MFNINIVQVENGYTLMVSTTGGCKTYIAPNEEAAARLVSNILCGNLRVSNGNPVKG